MCALDIPPVRHRLPTLGDALPERIPGWRVYMPKLRNHNEWFTTVSLGGRKSCPLCKAKLGPREWIWSWGEYVRGKWRTVKHFCKECYPEEVRKPLLRHTEECGCNVTIVVKHAVRPEWLELEETCPTK